VTGRIAFDTNRDDLARFIYLANPDGRVLVRLTAGSHPRWSRDGQRIAFERDGDIFTIDADGENEEFLVEGREPTWSPDGTQLAYVDGSGFLGLPVVGGIFVINADGTNPTLRLSHAFAEPPPCCTDMDVYGVFFPAWSPDGSRIAFTRLGPLEVDIYVMSATGSAAPSFAIEGASLAAWSPDSTRLAYLRLPATIASRTLGVAGETVHATVGNVGFSRPGWSPDGRSIIYTSANAIGLARIFVTRDGLPPTQLIPDAPGPTYGDSTADWSWAD
jgi:Tol biopolymer transport system component